MSKYELLPTCALDKSRACLRSGSALPELVHLDDPAFSVMQDFTQSIPRTISPEDTMDDALNEMKAMNVHHLLVMGSHDCVLGVIGSEDILGEKPIQLIQQRRIHRSKVLVKMIMVPIETINAFNIEDIEHARVGNIVNTLQTLRQHYALVIKLQEDGTQTLRGMFTASQISKQLHQNITSSIAKAQTLSELQKRSQSSDK